MLNRAFSEIQDAVLNVHSKAPKRKRLKSTLSYEEQMLRFKRGKSSGSLSKGMAVMSYRIY